jgi:hypothetical protein
MNNQRLLAGALIVGLLLILAVGITQAQEPVQDEDILAEEEVEAVVGNVIPIQGLLTDASGNHLNGSHAITASIYTSDVGGTAICTDTDTVNVVDGLLNMDMHFCSSLDISGDSLYLGIKVGADPEMTPRRAIYPVPYAFTVRPGAIIKGANSYVFIPSHEFLKNESADTTRWTSSGAATRIYRGGTLAGTKHIRIPITLPSVLYGQPVRVTGIRVYYRCQNGANNFITETQLYKQTDADSFVSLINDPTNRQSDIATSYSLATDSNFNTLSADEGILTLRLGMYFANDTEYVQIAGVRVTLNHNY